LLLRVSTEQVTLADRRKNVRRTKGAERRDKESTGTGKPIGHG
jgi:hypothetical protein